VYKPVNTANTIPQALKKMNTITLVLPDNRQTRAFIKMATSFLLKQAKVTKKQAIKVALKPTAPVVEPFTIAEPVAAQVVEPVAAQVVEPVVEIDEEKEVEKIMTLPVHVQPLALANLARRLPKEHTPEVDRSNSKPITIGRRQVNYINRFPIDKPVSEYVEEKLQAAREESAQREARLDALVVDEVNKEQAKLDIVRAEYVDMLEEHHAYMRALAEKEHAEPQAEPEAEYSQELIQSVLEEIACEEARLDGLVVDDENKEEAKLSILRDEHRAYIEAIREEEAEKDKEHADFMKTIAEDEAKMKLNDIDYPLGISSHPESFIYKQRLRFAAHLMGIETADRNEYYKIQQVLYSNKSDIEPFKNAVKEFCVMLKPEVEDFDVWYENQGIEQLYTSEQADIPDWDSPTDLTRYANRVPKDGVSQKFALDKCQLYKLRHLWNKKPTYAGKTYELNIEIDGKVYESYQVARAFKGSDTVGFVTLTWRAT